MGLPQQVPAISPAEYLEIERAANYRSEYFRGEMFAMAGGSVKHSRIKTNVLAQLHGRLKDRPRAAYDGDLRKAILAESIGSQTVRGRFASSLHCPRQIAACN